ncbi:MULTISPECIES: SET domain-containing protein [Galbibacter]|uniref:SET domain-containing protein n=1 Tax=Galbibacter pacificus TaxID=2996052 RepID=A0ABT6FSM2_9FLAO|nr:SET domain-containing protein [Galbibacter pacificus]MDG3582620.1 SET domain-containing protein [Galbibacter pacificus]MDG3586261.1 SET domain-containing protein [Galbibacter pacificus]
MIHPHTELRFISDEIGHGVVATQLIPKGTITWVQDQLDVVLTPAQVANMSNDYQHIIDYFTFRNNKGEYVLCWDMAKFVNHSFKSNCLTTPYDFEIAVRDIYPGEELTDDYGYLNIARPFKAKDEGTKRKIVYPDDLLKYHAVWDEVLKEAFRHINAVNQPLFKFLNESMLKKVRKIEKGEAVLDSILTCYYAEK